MALSTQAGGDGRAMSSLTQWKERQQQCAEEVDLQALLTTVRSTLRSQGLVAWVNVSLALEKAQSESGGLTIGALKRLLGDCRVAISDVDARALVQRASQGGEEDGRVTADAVKNLIFGPLTGRKLELVQSAFDTLDRKGVGYLAIQDALAAHDAGRHPAVMFGEQAAEQVAREFQTAFMTAARRTGTAFVSWAQWLTYFQCVAAQAPSDEYFELLMKRVWHADTRCSLQEAAGVADLNARMDLINPPAAPAAVAPVSLLQALQSNQNTSSNAKVVLSISTKASPREQHRTNSLSLSSMDPDASPRGTARHTTNEFLKGSQFAACITEVTSPVSSVSTVRSGARSIDTLDPGAASVLRKLQSGVHSFIT